MLFAYAELLIRGGIEDLYNLKIFFFYFSMETYMYVVTLHWNCLSKVVLMMGTRYV